MTRSVPKIASAVAVVAACTLYASSAFALGFQFKVKNQVSQTDGDHAELVLMAEDFVQKGTVTIKGKKTRKVKLGKMNPGATKAITLKAPKGSNVFKITIDAVGMDDAKVTIPLEIKTARVAPVKLKIDKDGVDTGKGVIPFKSNRPLDRIEMVVVDEGGDEVSEHSQSYEGAYGDLKFEWSYGGEVAALKLKAYDVDGFWTAVVLEPWFIEIKHEEVVFDSGSSEINASEVPKLEASLAEVQKKMKRFAKFRPDMRLYVGGYTDTVGPSGKNQTLSQARARAISRWFKSKGLKIPVYYQGFGEDGQAVKTEDNVDEPRNRRALYLLANSPPPTSKDIPRARWSRVK